MISYKAIAKPIEELHHTAIYLTPCAQHGTGSVFNFQVASLSNDLPAAERQCYLMAMLKNSQWITVIIGLIVFAFSHPGSSRSLHSNVTGMGKYSGPYSQSKYVKACLRFGHQKLLDQIEGFHLLPILNTFEVCAMDDHWFNPSKYIWFCMKAKAPNGKIAEDVTKLVQYYHGSCS